MIIIIISVVDMPAINIRKKFYDRLIVLGKVPTEVINDLVEKYLEKLE